MILGLKKSPKSACRISVNQRVKIFEDRRDNKTKRLEDFKTKDIRLSDFSSWWSETYGMILGLKKNLLNQRVESA